MLLRILNFWRLRWVEDDELYIEFYRRRNGEIIVTHVAVY